MVALTVADTIPAAEEAAHLVQVGYKPRSAAVISLERRARWPGDHGAVRRRGRRPTPASCAGPRS
ncbi:hypothetical protein [Lentzea pudingi]|uniref:hypothetical protein n=1 Tax=Lentzea pudingi TaxID=1789439 RepID=UPI003570F454